MSNRLWEILGGFVTLVIIVIIVGLAAMASIHADKLPPIMSALNLFSDVEGRVVVKEADESKPPTVLKEGETLTDEEYEEYLAQVAAGESRPPWDHVPAHLVCQTWQTYFARQEELPVSVGLIPAECRTKEMQLILVRRDPKHLFTINWWVNLDGEAVQETIQLAKEKGLLPHIVRAVPRKFWNQTLVDEYFQAGGDDLGVIPDFWIDYRVALLAVRRGGRNLQYVPEGVLIDAAGYPEQGGPELIWKTAILKDPTALQYVPWPARLENNCAISWLALENSNAALPYVPAICFRGGGIPPSVGNNKEND